MEVEQEEGVRETLEKLWGRRNPKALDAVLAAVMPADGSEPTRAYYAPPDKHAHHANTHSYSPVVVVCGEGVDTTWESTFIRIYVNDPFVEERIERLQRIALDYCASLNGGNAPANADCRALPGAPAGWAPPTATPTPTPTPSPTPTPTPTPTPAPSG